MKTIEPLDDLQSALRFETELREERRRIADEVNRLKAQLVFIEDRLRTAHCHVVEIESAIRNGR